MVCRVNNLLISWNGNFGSRGKSADEGDKFSEASFYKMFTGIFSDVLQINSQTINGKKTEIFQQASSELEGLNQSHHLLTLIFPVLFELCNESDV